jgi:hypothetical protein
LLETQRFFNLRGMGYLSGQSGSEAADAPATTFQAMGSTVRYIGSEMNNLPVALRQITQAWQAL